MFPQQLHHFTFPPAMHTGSNFSISLQHFFFFFFPFLFFLTFSCPPTPFVIANVMDVKWYFIMVLFFKKLNFIWGKIRTALRDTAPQIALRHCSKRWWGKVVKGNFMKSRTYLTKSFSAYHEEMMSL